MQKVTKLKTFTVWWRGGSTLFFGLEGCFSNITVMNLPLKSDHFNTKIDEFLLKKYSFPKKLNLNIFYASRHIIALSEKKTPFKCPSIDAGRGGCGGYRKSPEQSLFGKRLLQMAIDTALEIFG